MVKGKKKPILYFHMQLARSNFSIILKWEHFIVSGEYITEQSRCLD